MRHHLEPERLLGHEARILQRGNVKMSKVVIEKFVGIDVSKATLPPSPKKLDANRLHREMLGYKLFGIFREIPI
jgi:hypothetical protein